MKIFLDGAETGAASLAAGSHIFHGREPLMIGSGSNGTMTVDDVRLYTQNLSASDLDWHYGGKPVRWMNRLCYSHSRPGGRWMIRLVPQLRIHLAMRNAGTLFRRLLAWTHKRG